MVVKGAWETETGATVDWSGTHDAATDLQAAIEEGLAPDIAVLPNPGVMQQLAKSGALKPLNGALDMNEVEADYAKSWLDLGSSDGALYGIFYKVTNKATVWYDPAAFNAADYDPPKTWDELTTLADEIVGDGRTPFSMAAGGGPANGWALTDWISEILLNNCGPTAYDDWIATRIPWTDPCIKRSFQLFDEIVATHGNVLGGAAGIVGTTDSAGTYPVYSDPPTAYMDYVASFAQAFIASKYPSLKPGADYAYSPFPSITQAYAGGVTVGADLVVIVNDTPAARSLMAYLAGADSQQAWIRLGGFTSVNRSVPLDAYPDVVARQVASDLMQAPVTRFGAGDMMPSTLQRAWWQAMLELVNDPGQLDAILDALTTTARAAK